MSKNLLKHQFTRLDTEDVRIIDANVLLKSKLKVSPDKVVPAEPDEDGFARGIASDVLSLEPDAENEDSLTEQAGQAAEPVYDGPSPEELIEEARQQIADMQAQAKADAKKEADRIKEEARQNGYREGMAKAEQELKAAEQKLHDKQVKLEQDYEERLDHMEPELAKTLAGIYEYIFKVDLAPYKDIVTYLVTNTLKKTGEGRHCIVHVSKEDYPFVSSQKKQITSGLPSSTVVEFVEDITLGKNDALIETDGGIFDCGLGTQLAELKAKIELLSYEQNEG